MHHDQYILDLERASVRACTLILMRIHIKDESYFFLFSSKQRASVCMRLPHKRCSDSSSSSYRDIDREAERIRVMAGEDANTREREGGRETRGVCLELQHSSIIACVPRVDVQLPLSSQERQPHSSSCLLRSVGRELGELRVMLTMTGQREFPPGFL